MARGGFRQLFRRLSRKRKTTHLLDELEHKIHRFGDRVTGVQQHHKIRPFLGQRNKLDHDADEMKIEVGADRLDPIRMDLKTTCQLYNSTGYCEAN